ncbi:hypothetical protein HanHA300_Chr13g0479491 [Helianthus annuus]|nr:hypothetical protein HanHA300_Chr13g0479491 [Helianthus annuus]KAJ0670965.1 hypothetical protein HanOQP8_Chr13g0480441 [Helianthus annuus]
MNINCKFILYVFRCPVEMSACLESLQPFHTATASALMTSMLTLSQRGYGWLPEGKFTYHEFNIIAIQYLVCK